VDGTGSESSPVTGFPSGGFEPLEHITSVLNSCRVFTVVEWRMVNS
jgi:hypothetical protein